MRLSQDSNRMTLDRTRSTLFISFCSWPRPTSILIVPKAEVFFERSIHNPVLSRRSANHPRIIHMRRRSRCCAFVSRTYKSSEIRSSNRAQEPLLQKLTRTLNPLVLHSSPSSRAARMKDKFEKFSIINNDMRFDH